MPRPFTPPAFPDAPRTLLARQVWFLAWSILGIACLITVVESIVLPAGWLRWVTTGLCTGGLCGLSLWLARRGVPRTAARVLVGGLLLTACALSWSGGIVHSPVTLTFLPLVFIAGLLLGLRTGLLAGALVGGWAILLALAEQTGHLPAPSIEHTPLSAAVVLLLGLGLVALAQFLADDEVIRARTKADTAATARSLSEAALHESEQRLALAMEAATDGIYDVDLLTGESYCSPRYYTMLGYAPGEFAPGLASWQQLIHPDDQPVAAAAMARYREGSADSHSIETRLRTKDGAWRWVLSRGRIAARDPAGLPLRLIGTHVDIDERKQAELALRESEERLRSIVDHAPFGALLYLLQPDGRLVFQAANASADAILHINHRPLVGRDILEAFPGLRGTDIPDTYRQVIATGQPHHRPQFAYDEGSIRGAFDVHALSIGHQRVVVFFTDITERKRAEAALRESEERLRQLFNSGNDAVFVHRVRANGEHDRIIQVNDIACQLLGYTREELLALSIPELSTAEFAPRIAGTVARLQREHHALFDMELVARDGHRVPVEINSRVFELDGLPTVLSVVRDITERKHLEDQLRQAQKMEVFGQLAGGVAHDFNNLLVAIIGNAELLLDGAQVTGHPREQLEQIHDAGRRAAALTRQLLLFSRKQQPQPMLGDLGTIVTNHVKLLRRIIGEDIDLTVERAPGPLPVLADVNMVEQVAMNLVVNARDAMPRGGTLTLATRRTVLDGAAASRAACPPGTYASLIVRDTGPGIPPEIRQRIFEPFFTTKAAGKGTGLGLSTVLGIVQQHHGGIVLESEPGEGTSFTIHLPLANVDTAEPSSPAKPAATAATPATILVVEDDDAVRTIVEHTLRRHRYLVLTATTVAEGLVHLERGEPAIDLVLSDVVMPGGVGGVQLAQEVAERWPWVVVLLMSGYARELEDTGMRLLQKPFTLGRLLAFVQEGLAGR